MGISFTEGEITNTLPDTESWVGVAYSGGAYTYFDIGPLYEVAEIVDATADGGTTWAKTSSGLSIHLPVDRISKLIGVRNSEWGINTSAGGHEYKLVSQAIASNSGPNSETTLSTNPSKGRIAVDVKILNSYYPMTMSGLNEYIADIYKDGWNDACKLIKFTSSKTSAGSITVPKSLTTVADDNSSSKVTYALTAATEYPVDSSTHKTYVRGKATLTNSSDDTVAATGYSSQYGINTPYNDGWKAGWEAAAARCGKSVSGGTAHITFPQTSAPTVGSTGTDRKFKISATKTGYHSFDYNSQGSISVYSGDTLKRKEGSGRSDINFSGSYTYYRGISSNCTDTHGASLGSWTTDT